ncbi:MAG: nucleoside permease [Bacteroidota bacterium]
MWGGWFVTLGTYLGVTLEAADGEIAKAFSTQSWGAIIAPFVIGLIADRYFNAERILAVLHLVGAFLMYQLANASDFSTFYPYVLGYMIAYMPTLALVNSVSFNQMKDPAKEFSLIRVWGTIGWIVAGLAISYAFGWDSKESVEAGGLRNTFMMCAAASLALGLFSLSLPKTPPKAKGTKAASIGDLLGFEALTLLKERNFLIFFISSILICIPLAFYYQYTNPFLQDIGMANSTGKMTIGQMSEVLFMLLLPIFLKRFGIKKTLLLGMAAWVIRYLLFAYGDVDGKGFMLILGIALHGICYDFFFVSGQIYTDAKAGERYKSAAQGLITLATYGIGMLIGFEVAGMIANSYTDVAGVKNWTSIWTMPAIFAAVVLVIFFLAFREEEGELEV